MQHAAAATIDETPRFSEPSEPFCAFLSLRQGASERASWLVEEALGGTMISVGADEACDWQIRAAFVPPRAFSLLVVGGRTFVRSGPEPGVLLNGRAIDDGWIQVPNGGRIDVGLARLEVTMGYGDPSEDLTETLQEVEPSWSSTSRTANQPQYGQPRQHTSGDYGRATLDLGVMPLDAEPLPLTTPRTRSREQPRASENPSRRHARPSIERTLEQLYMDADVRQDEQRVQGALSDQVPQARMLGRESMLGHESGEFSTATGEFSAPSLLDDPASDTDKRRWWLYAVVGVVVAGAYGGWVVLLDFL